MPRRLVFAVVTPLGYRVTLSRNRWRELVRFKHPALAGHENDVRECLLDPQVIRRSAKDPAAHVYYRKSDRGYLAVVVGIDDQMNRLVVTAYFTRSIKEGDELWTK